MLYLIQTYVHKSWHQGINRTEHPRNVTYQARVSVLLTRSWVCPQSGGLLRVCPAQEGPGPLLLHSSPRRWLSSILLGQSLPLRVRKNHFVVCIYARTHTHAHKHAHTRTYTHAHMHTRSHTQTHTLH